MSGQATGLANKPTKAEVDAEVGRLSTLVKDEQQPLDKRAMSACRIIDLRRDELTAGVDPRIDRVKLIETVKLLIREQAEKIVGCTFPSVMRSVKAALLSGLAIDKFKGEVDFIPRNKKIKIGGREEWVKELCADPNYRGLIHFVGNTGQMERPPFVECVYEGESLSFDGEADAMIIKHVRDPLNKYRMASDPEHVIGCYCRWYLKGRTVNHFMAREQILAHGRKYSKAWQDAEKNGRRDSFWHKEPIKAMLKTLLRDAVNRDLVPVSREDKGYLLEAVASERQEWSETTGGEIVDAEFETHHTGDPVVSDEHPTLEPLGQENLDAVFDRYLETLARAKDAKAAVNARDAWFGPDSPHEWGQEQRVVGERAYADKAKELGAK